MESIAQHGVGIPVLLAYGFIILLYIIILRLLLNLLQQMGDKHIYQRSVIDRDIHQTMNNRVDASMHTFDVYNIAIIIAKGGVAAIAMAAIIVLLVVKVGVLATSLLIAIVIIGMWAVNRWLKSQETAGSIRGEVGKIIQKTGSTGTIILLNIALVVLLFIMLIIH